MIGCPLSDIQNEQVCKANVNLPHANNFLAGMKYTGRQYLWVNIFRKIALILWRKILTENNCCQFMFCTFPR